MGQQGPRSHSEAPARADTSIDVPQSVSSVMGSHGLLEVVVVVTATHPPGRSLVLGIIGDTTPVSHLGSFMHQSEPGQCPGVNPGLPSPQRRFQLAPELLLRAHPILGELPRQRVTVPWEAWATNGQS